MHKICEICGAAILEADGRCEFNVREDIAPWLDDYKAMHLGLMSHAEHQAVVVRLFFINGALDHHKLTIKARL